MPMFSVNPPIAVGTNPVSNATADVNGDGHLDLLFANYISDNVSILLGDGNGGFTASTPVAVDNGPRQIMVGDLDGDGDIDFLATNYAANNVSVRLNNGDGTFVAAASVAVGSAPRGMALGDLDGDGDLDFVSCNYNSNSLSIMLNNGDATYTQQAGSPMGSGGNRPTQMVMVDLDGDDDLDLAVTNNSGNTVGLLFNNGTGSFAAAVTTPTGAGPRGIASGDVDGDGDADLVVTNFGANTVSILRNNGVGGFTAGTPVATANNPYDTKLADLDGDGDLDMVVSNSGSSSLSVFINNGRGTFAPANGSPVGVGVSPGGISVGDFDEDGDLDIASTNFGSSTTSIAINMSSFYALTKATSSIVEGSGLDPDKEIVFTIRRNRASEAEDISYELGGTATAGTDYAVPAGSVSFAEGQKIARVHIAVTADDIHELKETVTLTLTTGSKGAFFKSSTDSLSTTIRNDDILRGTNADNDLTGNHEAEVIRAKGGADHIVAKGGSDRIFGDGGEDIIFGGGGRDVMTGGSGDDDFVFALVSDSRLQFSKRDIITDFTFSHDEIDLSAIDARGGVDGNQAFKWHGSGNFVAGKEGWLVMRTFDRPGTAKDETVIFGDVDGDKKADFQIELSGLKSLHADDFLL